MNDSYITVIGNVVDDPRSRDTSNGHRVTNFRLASTSRRYNRQEERYEDNQSLYITVTSWRAMAENVAQSVHKGQAVVVHGKLIMREYRKDEVNRVAYELEAVAVGHDLSRGVSRFERVRRASGNAIEVGKDGLPPDDSDHWVGLAPDAVPAGADDVLEPDDPRRDVPEAPVDAAPVPADAPAKATSKRQLVGSR